MFLNISHIRILSIFINELYKETYIIIKYYSEMKKKWMKKVCEKYGIRI